MSKLHVALHSYPTGTIVTRAMQKDRATLLRADDLARRGVVSRARHLRALNPSMTWSECIVAAERWDGNAQQTIAY